MLQTPTDFEQEMLELLNRARMNPAGEFDALILDAASRTGVTPDISNALRYFNVDMTVLRAQFDALVPVAPLAWNGALAAAAEDHSALMVARNQQAHVLPGELGIGDRLAAAGYDWWGWGENVYAYAEDAVYGHAGFFIDWGNAVPGHRNTIMNGDLTEVGIGVIASGGTYPDVGPFVVTQDFGSRAGYVAQLLGVVFDDADGDAFYDAGEGLGGVTVTAVDSIGQSFVTTTWSSGGYQMELAPGSYTVIFSGGGLGGYVTQTVAMGSQNTKLDALAEDAQGRPEGTSGDDMLHGTPENDIIDGLAGNDTIYGYAGADLLIGGLGRDALHGGAGNDILLGEGVDAVFDPVAAQVWRLYQATLDRAPDAGGLMGWTGRLLDGSQTLATAAAGFVGSAEFQRTYGATDNAQFVTLLYNNVLDRAPDPTGLAGWTARLEGGMSRAQAVLGFSESREFTRNTAADVLEVSRAGLQADWSDDVFRLYQATLDRAPDPGGFLGWTARLAQGRDFLDVVDGFIRSAEFQRSYGGTDNGQFVTLLYNNVLDRGPDPGGLAGWTARLDSGGWSRAEVVQGFARSIEFVRNSTPDLVAWMRAQGPDDTLAGGPGDDILMGGIGADTFVFNAADAGHDRVVGLEAWDRLRFEDFGYGSAAEARSHMTQMGSEVHFADQGVEITFTATLMSQITAGMIEI